MGIKKRFMSIVMWYLFTLSVVPCVFLTQTAEAATTTKDYTTNYNILGGYVVQSTTYKNYGVILSNNGLFLVKNNNYQRYIHSALGSYKLMGVFGDTAYMVSNLHNKKNPDLKVANLSTGEYLTKKLPKLDFDYVVADAITNYDGSLWFSVGTETGTNINYYIMRLDAATNDYLLYPCNYSKTGAPVNFHSNGNGNIWFTYSHLENTIGKLNYATGKISINLYTTDFNFESYIVNGINDFYLYNYPNKITKYSLKNNAVVETGSYSTPTTSAMVDELSIDKSGKLWYLSGTKNYTLFKLENNSFIPKYNVTVGGNISLNVVDDNHFTTASMGEFNNYGVAIYTNVSID